jgi:transcriptional repressor NrdR
MVCVYCNGATHVINSRAQKRNNRVWRRRQCLECKRVFSTEESVQYENVWLVMDASGGYSPFSPDKLQLSLYRSCQHRKTALNDAVALSNTITQKLQPKFKDGLINSQTIAQVSQVALNRFDRAASVNYSAYHHQKVELKID